MSHKKIAPRSDTELLQGWQSNVDEIDLRELVMILWRQKGFILMITFFFTALGLAYALLARQVWTSQALVSEPTVTQVTNLQLNIEQFRAAAGSEMIATTPTTPTTDFSSLQRPALYQGFIAAFNAMNNKRTFLTQEGIFAKEMTRAGVSDRRGERALMSKLAEDISAMAPDKLSTDMTLRFSAETAEEAQRRLIKYIGFIQQVQVASKNAELKSIWQNRIATLTTQYANIKTDTIQDRLDMIRRTQYSLRISEAAGVEKPLENMSTEDIFSIDLGSKALGEKLRILEEMNNPELLNPMLGKIRLQLASLKALELKDVSFESFYAIDTPEEPFSRDKPKRPLIVVLATLLGGILGVAIVLIRHTFRRPEQV